jgi:hypothetical protein
MIFVIVLLKKLLNKIYKKNIKMGKILDAKEKRKKLIENFLKNNDFFWKDISQRRGARVEVNIDLEVLRRSYEENFYTINQTEASRELETKMKNIVERYAAWVSKNKVKIKVKPAQIIGIMKKLKNRKRGGF